MSSTIDLTATGLSDLIYQDSKLVLSVIPTENCTFTSAALYGHDVSGKIDDSYGRLYFSEIADADNECSAMLSVAIRSDRLKYYMTSL